jgi:threonine dehydratase
MCECKTCCEMDRESVSVKVSLLMMMVDEYYNDEEVDAEPAAAASTAAITAAGNTRGLSLGGVITIVGVGVLSYVIDDEDEVADEEEAATEARFANAPMRWFSEPV